MYSEQQPPEAKGISHAAAENPMLAPGAAGLQEVPKQGLWGSER